MNRKVIAVLLFLSAPLFCFAETVNIYHTSDTHGFYFPRVIDGKQTGGFAALAALINKEDEPYILLDSGDFTSGTYEAKQTKGALSIDFFNMLGYSATTVGNHEADFKEDALAKNLRSSKFDIIAANFYDKKTGKLADNVKPYKTYLVGGRKIGVIGIAKDPKPNSKVYKTKTGRKELKKAVYELKKQNPDVIVVLIHNGYADDKHEATKDNKYFVKGIEDIDLVLGGHVHKIVNEKKDGVLFVESGSELRGVSKISLDFDEKTGKLEDIEAQYIPLLISKTGQDAKVAEFAEANRAKAMDVNIGYAKEKIGKDSPNTRIGVDSPLGNMLADIIKNETKAEVALHNTGGVRVNIDKGPVTKRLVNEVFPFPNKMMVLKINGKMLRKIILNALKEDRSLFQYSGLNVRYRYKNKRPSIVDITINGEFLQNDRVYTVAVNDYIAEGNSEGYLFKKIPAADKQLVGDRIISDIFIEYLNANKDGITAPAVGRIKKIVNEK